MSPLGVEVFCLENPHFLGKKSWQLGKTFELAKTSIETPVYFCVFMVCC